MGFLIDLFTGRKTSSPPSGDQRRVLRYSVMQAVELRSGAIPTPAVLVDLSRLGARLMTGLAFKSGTTIGLVLSVDGKSRALPFRVDRSREVKGAHEYGGEFTHLTAEQSEHLARYLGQLARRRAPLIEDRCTA